MNKVKVLTILVGILFVLNLGLMYMSFFGLKSDNKGPGPGFGQENADLFIKSRFGFDEDQMKSFKESKSTHGKSLRPVNKQLQELSRSYYLSYDKDNEIQDSILSEIQKLDVEIYKINSRHFAEVALICTEKQKPELNNFIRSLVDGQHDARNRPRRGEGPRRDEGPRRGERPPNGK